MVINKFSEGNKLTLILDGRLDTLTAPKLEEAFNESVSEIEELVLDFTKLEYISSAGLRVVLKAHKIMSARGGMKILGANDVVMEVFEITGFVDVLSIV